MGDRSQASTSKSTNQSSNDNGNFNIEESKAIDLSTGQGDMNPNRSLMNGESSLGKTSDSCNSFAMIIFEQIPITTHTDEPAYQKLKQAMEFPINYPSLQLQLKNFDTPINNKNYQKTLEKQFDKIKKRKKEGKLQEYFLNKQYSDDYVTTILTSIRFLTLSQDKYNERQTKAEETINEISNALIFKERRLLNSDKAEQNEELNKIRTKLINLAVYFRCIASFAKQITLPFKDQNLKCYKIFPKNTIFEESGMLDSLIIASESLGTALKSYTLLQGFTLLVINIPSGFDRAAQVGDISKRPQDNQVIVLPFTYYSLIDTFDKEHFGKLLEQEVGEERTKRHFNKLMSKKNEQIIVYEIRLKKGKYDE